MEGRDLYSRQCYRCRVNDGDKYSRQGEGGGGGERCTVDGRD